MTQLRELQEQLKANFAPFGDIDAQEAQFTKLVTDNMILVDTLHVPRYFLLCNYLSSVNQAELQQVSSQFEKLYNNIVFTLSESFGPQKICRQDMENRASITELRTPFHIAFELERIVGAYNLVGFQNHKQSMPSTYGASGMPVTNETVSHLAAIAAGKLLWDQPENLKDLGDGVRAHLSDYFGRKYLDQQAYERIMMIARGPLAKIGAQMTARDFHE